MSNVFTLIIIKLELIFIKKYLIEMFVINFKGTSINCFAGDL